MLSCWSSRLEKKDLRSRWRTVSDGLRPSVKSKHCTQQATSNEPPVNFLRINSQANQQYLRKLLAMILRATEWKKFGSDTETLKSRSKRLNVEMIFPTLIRDPSNSKESIPRKGKQIHSTLTTFPMKHHKNTDSAVEHVLTMWRFE